MFEFGTDGVRGKANETLPVEVAYRLGSYLGDHYSKEEKGKILIAKDTRLSSGMYEMAVAAGIAAHGCDVYLEGYAPTPSVAHLVITHKFACGIMISASHNPYYDNGIKVFSAQGSKLDRKVEQQIETYLNAKEDLPNKTNDQIGQVIDWPQGLEEYLTWLEDLHPLNLKGVKLALDTANGSSSFTAYRLLTKLGATCDNFNHEPNGLNINTNCGSTHPGQLIEIMKKGDYDLGLAFDGDADRLIAIAPDGQEITGDKVLYSLGKYLKSKGKLPDDTIVTTVMANLGLFKKLDEAKIAYKITPVGDKYVHEEMVKGNYQIGGEQSGHIIFLDQATTGDGLLTALNILEMIQDTGKSINELTDDLFIYPQLLVNVKVKNKQKVQDDPEVKAACKKVEKALGNEGRILVRPSGTEPLLRVMVEAKTDQLCKEYVDQVVDVVKEVNEKL